MKFNVPGDILNGYGIEKISATQVLTVSLQNKKITQHKYYTTFKGGYEDYLNPEIKKNL